MHEQLQQYELRRWHTYDGPRLGGCLRSKVTLVQTKAAETKDCCSSVGDSASFDDLRRLRS